MSACNSSFATKRASKRRIDSMITIFKELGMIPSMVPSFQDDLGKSYINGLLKKYNKITGINNEYEKFLDILMVRDYTRPIRNVYKELIKIFPVEWVDLTTRIYNKEIMDLSIKSDMRQLKIKFIFEGITIVEIVQFENFKNVYKACNKLYTSVLGNFKTLSILKNNEEIGHGFRYLKHCMNLDFIRNVVFKIYDKKFPQFRCDRVISDGNDIKTISNTICIQADKLGAVFNDIHNAINYYQLIGDDGIKIINDIDFFRQYFYTLHIIKTQHKFSIIYAKKEWIFEIPKKYNNIKCYQLLHKYLIGVRRKFSKGLKTKTSLAENLDHSFSHIRKFFIDKEKKKQLSEDEWSGAPAEWDGTVTPGGVEYVPPKKEWVGAPPEWDGAAAAACAPKEWDDSESDVSEGTCTGPKEWDDSDSGDDVSESPALILQLKPDPHEKNNTNRWFFRNTDSVKNGIYAIRNFDPVNTVARSDRDGLVGLYQRGNPSEPIDIDLDEVFTFYIEPSYSGEWFLAAYYLGTNSDPDERYMFLSNPIFSHAHMDAQTFFRKLEDRIDISDCSDSDSDE